MKINEFLTKFLSILGVVFMLQVINAEFVLAEDDELTCTLARITKSLSGPMGKSIATIAIIALGIGLFMGKLSWGLAVATALGVSMIFGAESIINWLAGGTAFTDGSSDCGTS